MSQFRSQLLQLIHQNGLHRPPHIDRYPLVGQVLGADQYGLLSEQLARMYLPLVAEIADRIFRSPNVTFLPDEQSLYADGPPEIELGTTENNLRVGIRRPTREVAHLLACGATGTGKTVFLRNAILKLSQLIESKNRRCSIIVIDPKLDFSDIPSIAPGDWLHFDAATTLRVGLQNPPHVSRDAWIAAISTSLAARCGMVSARIPLASILRWLCQVIQDDLGLKDHWPTPVLVLDVLRAAPQTLFGSKAEYLKTLEQALVDIVENTGQLLSCSRGLCLVRDVIWQGKHVVIGLEGLTLPAGRAFLVDLLVSQVFLSRLFEHRKIDATEVVMAIDESDEFISRMQEQAFGTQLPMLQRAVKQGREPGIAFWLTASVLSGVSPMILANTTDKVMFNQADAQSVLDASRTLLLPAGGYKQVATLHRGQAIMKQSLSPWPHPTLVDVDYVEPYRGSRPTPDTHPYIEAKRLSEWPELAERLQKKIDSHVPAQFHRSRAARKELPSAAREFLDMSSLLPFWPVARVWDRIGKPSASTQKAVRKRLTADKLARFKDVRTSKQNTGLIEILDPGWKLLNKRPSWKLSRGGIEHSSFSAWIRMVGEKRGYRAETELIVPKTNHAVDVAWEIDSGLHVFEVVVTGLDNIASHLHACFVESDAVTTLTIVTAQRRMHDAIRPVIEAQFAMSPVLNRIRFEVIATYMKELWP